MWEQDFVASRIGGRILVSIRSRIGSRNMSRIESRIGNKIPGVIGSWSSSRDITGPEIRQEQEQEGRRRSSQIVYLGRAGNRGSGGMQQ